jgi:hypothetical protein
MAVTSDALLAWWPPTLTPSPVWRCPVRGVDDPGGQPQHPPLDFVEHLLVHGCPTFVDPLGHHPMLPRPAGLSTC